MSSSLKEKILYIWVNVCRLLVGATFIFSGFVKAVDPMGTYYKVSDYMTAFGFGDVFPDYVLILFTIFLSTFEFFIGVNTLLAIRRKITTSLLFVFMLIMTALTLYLAIANPVSDCGCFGDAVKLTNWETFFKNAVLLVFSFSLLTWSSLMFRIMTWRVQWIVSVYSLIFVIGLSVYCLDNLPVLDFRPYRIGTDIRQSMAIPENASKTEFETTFILEKGGVRKEFTIEDYPQDTAWHFVDSRTITVKQGYEPPITNFSISLLPEMEDITDIVLNDTNYTFLLIIPAIEKASDDNIDRINDIYDYSVDNGYGFYCLTSSSEEMITFWKEYMGAEYEFCMTDETVLKTIVRANPGMVLLKNGVIVDKWNHKHLPSDSDLNMPLEMIYHGTFNPSNDYLTLLVIVILYVIPLAFIIGLEAIWLKINKINDLD